MLWRSSSKYGINTVFENLEGFPEDWKTNAPAFVKFVREHQCPSFLEYGEYPYVSADEIKKALKLKAAFRTCSTRCSDAAAGRAMLEFDDIQHILLTRRPRSRGDTSFSRFATPRADGRGWRPFVRNGAVGRGDAGFGRKEKRWVTVAFTWNGLRALGVDEASLATFPEEFKQGMVARAEMLGDTGENHPDHWVGGLASPDLHAIVILFARDEAERRALQCGARKARRAMRGR